MSTALTSAGPHVNQPISLRDQRSIVFDHEHGIAFVAQLRQRRSQQFSIACVQTGARFIKDIQHLRHPRFERGAKAQPLILAAGQRVGAAAQRQIAYSQRIERAQTRAQIAAYFIRHHGAHTRKLQRFDKAQGSADRQTVELSDV